MCSPLHLCTLAPELGYLPMKGLVLVSGLNFPDVVPWFLNQVDTVLLVVMILQLSNKKGAKSTFILVYSRIYPLMFIIATFPPFPLHLFAIINHGRTNGHCPLHAYLSSWHGKKIRLMSKLHYKKAVVALSPSSPHQYETPTLVIGEVEEG